MYFFKCALTIFFLSPSFSIVPPKNGKFSQELLTRFKEQDIGNDYGNLGWVNKINLRKQTTVRDAQLEFNIPVLLGKYADVSNTYFSANDYQNLLFDQNETGTMTEYYTEISYGNFLLDGETGGWYQSYLTQNEAVNQVKSYVSNIAALADADFNYGLYDNDGPDNIPNSGDDDGYVDGLVVVYPGCLDGDNNLWAHQSSLGNSKYVTNDLAPNGENIIVDTYMVCPELSAGLGQTCNTDLIFQMGTFAHEFGHVLGLPDLYDRNSNDGDSEGVGEWCLMASANWLGNNGDTPAHMSAWCKIELGWMNPTIISGFETSVAIAELATSPTAIKIWEDDYRSSRYFLIENRQKTGFDSGLNGEGILIYHVNENRSWGTNGWSWGPVNDDETDKMIDVECADGNLHLDNEINRGDVGDPFPGSSDNRNFNNFTNPSSVRNNGFQTNIRVDNISASDSVMYADMNSMSNSGYTISYDENGIAATSITIGTDVQYSGVHFTSERGGFLTEIDFGLTYSGFWNTDLLSWEVMVYDDFSDQGIGNLLQIVSGNSDEGGWKTITIDSIPISPDQDFFVAVKFYDNGYVYSFDNTGVFSERSYYSANGSTYYSDLSSYGDANIRAKLSTDIYNSVKKNHLSFPDEFSLYPNYPNPFNPKTNISFNLEHDAEIVLEIYDLKGRVIETIIDGNFNSGHHSITWNADQYSSGVYFAIMSYKDFSQIQKMILLK